MARGTLFGEVHSFTDLHLIQQSVEIPPALPKTNIVEVPGANGGKDLTEALGVGVKYQDRTIKWTFALYGSDNWHAKMAQVSNALNGRSCRIVLDDDAQWFYAGRISVTEHKKDMLLRQITVEATCRPHKYKVTPSSVSRTDLNTNLKQLACNIGVVPLIPTITVAQPTIISWNNAQITLNTGTHNHPDLYMSGEQVLKAKVISGTGSITIAWREGSL